MQIQQQVIIFDLHPKQRLVIYSYSLTDARVPAFFPSYRYRSKIYPKGVTVIIEIVPCSQASARIVRLAIGLYNTIVWQESSSFSTMMTVAKQSYLFCHMPLYIRPSKHMVIFINGAATEDATETAPLAHLAHERERERERGAILWHGDHRIQCWLGSDGTLISRLFMTRGSPCSDRGVAVG
jgi:hypothetical protein